MTKPTFAARCQLAQDCLPDTPYRTMLKKLHDEMLDAIEQEREVCAKVCEARFMGDLNREDMEAKRCAAAIRARNSA